MPILNKGSACASIFLLVLVTSIFFSVNPFFQTKTMQQKSLLLHTPDMQKQAYFCLLCFSCQPYRGAGGTRKSAQQGNNPTAKKSGQVSTTKPQFLTSPFSFLPFHFLRHKSQPRPKPRLRSPGLFIPHFFKPQRKKSFANGVFVVIITPIGISLV